VATLRKKTIQIANWVAALHLPKSRGWSPAHDLGTHRVGNSKKMGRRRHGICCRRRRSIQRGRASIGDADVPSPVKRDYRQLGIWVFPHDDKRTYQDLVYPLRCYCRATPQFGQDVGPRRPPPLPRYLLHAGHRQFQKEKARTENTVMGKASAKRE
jgi:hypothetical protein